VTDRIGCPEWGCGLKVDEDELLAHLQMIHNYSELRAQRRLDAATAEAMDL
jgi:hypothetical protein